MITKFKIYDSINQGEPEKGDYVIVNQNDDDHYFDDDTTNSLNNNIHRLINIIYNSNSTSYVIDFSISWLVNRDEIIYWAKNKEELEPLLNSKKFNI